MAYLRISLITFTSSALLGAVPIHGAQQRTAADDTADREFAIARTEINFIHRVLGAEMQRLMAERKDPQSPDVARLLDSGSTKRPDIGDTHIPLHLRLVERERLNLVAGIELARSSVGYCGKRSTDPSQLVDELARERALKSIRCHRDKLSKYQHGVHEVNKAHELTGLALKLPPFTQEKVLTEDRKATQKQDTDLEVAYALERKRDKPAEDFIKFLGVPRRDCIL